MKKLFLQSLDRQINSNPWVNRKTCVSESIYDEDDGDWSDAQPSGGDLFGKQKNARSKAPQAPPPPHSSTVAASSAGPTTQVVASSAAAANEPTVTVSLDSFLKVLEQHNKQQKWLQQFAMRASAAMTNVDAQEPYIINKIVVSGEELSSVGNDTSGDSNNKNVEQVIKKHMGACFTLDFYVDVLENVIVRYQQELWRKRFGSVGKKWKRKNWTKVSLLEQICNNVSLKKCLIRRQQQPLLTEDEKSEQEQKQEEAEENKNSSEQLNDNMDDLACHIGILNNSIVMLCGEPGLYHIQLVVDVSIERSQQSSQSTCKSSTFASYSAQSESTSPRSIVLYFASQAVKNELDFKIHHEDVQVKVSPALYVQKKKISTGNSDEDDLDSPCFTQVTCSYPPTRTLTVNWTPKIKAQAIPLLMPDVVKIEEDSDKKVQLPLTLTSQQNILHAIGEGLVRSTAVFDYSIVNGSLNQLEIMIDPYGAPFKVLSVSGGNIKDWSVYDQKELETEDELSLDDAEQLNKQNSHSKKILKIQFKYGVERSLNLKINTELEMGGTSAKVFAPSMTSQNVTRETGTIAVVARTNVEIKEEGRKFLRKIDSTELPHVQRLSPYPILHSYRFLEKGHELHLNVTRHDDVEVLCACIETCVYDITLSSGKLLHKIKMYIRNTAKQYLRIRLNKSAEVWSTTVDEKSVKPSSEAQKDTKLILIPLNKKDACNTMLVEFVFTVPSDKLEGRGTFKLNLAKFDSPINIMNLSLFFPKDFNFSEFVGDIKEVEYFRSSPQGSVQSMLDGNLSSILNRGEKLDRLLDQTAELESGSHQFLKRSKAVGGGAMSRFFSGVSETAGLKPVNLGSIDSTTGLKQFRFERYLLLENQSIQLTADYKEIKKGLFERRTTQGSKTWYYIFALVVLLCALAVYFNLFSSLRPQHE